MRIEFNIHFRTRPDEKICITGSVPELGDLDLSKALEAQYKGDGRWSAEIELSISDKKSISYRYIIISSSGEIIHEKGEERKVALSGKIGKITLVDQWQGNSFSSIFLTSPFSVFFKRRDRKESSEIGKSMPEIIIRVTLPNIDEKWKLFLCGDRQELGAWDPDNALEMRAVSGMRWEIHLPAENISGNIYYKFIKKRLSGDDMIWEEGENHHLYIPEFAENEAILYEHSSANFPVAHPRYTGTAVPLFSLRSEKSYGVGDLGDLKLFIDWIASTGQHIIQLLPINDTCKDGSRKDSYPYNCISVFAIHPIYIDINDMGRINDRAIAIEFEKERIYLNSLDKMDYERVLDLKMRVLRVLFEEYAEKTFASSEFNSFFNENRSWLSDYAAFCALRDRFCSVDFSSWGRYARYNKEIIDELGDPFYIFIQFHLYRQLAEIKKYASDKGVVLKGDLPIGISPYSADAWRNSDLFNLNMQAGAPPDAFSDEGQNWGFPTYNWERMREDNYAWWRARLSLLSAYFDIYRIDHILGFFRIWEIPVPEIRSASGHFNPAIPYTKREIGEFGFDFSDATAELFVEDNREAERYHPRIDAQMSDRFKALSLKQREAFNRLYDYFFYQRHNELWADHALKILPHIISASNMFPCGEDLGMMSDSVPYVMKSLNIASLEIERMPKKPGVKFTNPGDYDYLSVASTGTHDMSTLRGWWKEDREATQLFYTEILQKRGEAPESCEPWICEEIIRKHLDSPSIFAIFPLQDWLALKEEYRVYSAEDERINVPRDPDHYWRYRMPVNIETLIEDKEYNYLILLMIQNCGR